MVVRDELQAARQRSCGLMGIFMLWEKLISFIKLNLSEQSQRPTVFLVDRVESLDLQWYVYIQYSMFSRWG